jgi:hypothetical protein
MPVEVHVAGTLFPSRQMQRAESQRLHTKTAVNDFIRTLLAEAERMRRCEHKPVCAVCKQGVERGDLVFVCRKWTCDNCLPQ